MAVQVELNRQVSTKRAEQAAACQARIEKVTARLQQLEAELASPMAGQITSKDRENLKVLQVRSYKLETCHTGPMRSGLKPHSREAVAVNNCGLSISRFASLWSLQFRSECCSNGRRIMGAEWRRTVARPGALTMKCMSTRHALLPTRAVSKRKEVSLKLETVGKTHRKSLHRSAWNWRRLSVLWIGRMRRPRSSGKCGKACATKLRKRRQRLTNTMRRRCAPGDELIADRAV